MRKMQWPKIFQVYGFRDQIEKFKILKKIDIRVKKNFWWESHSFSFEHELVCVVSHKIVITKSYTFYFFLLAFTKIWNSFKEIDTS